MAADDNRAVEIPWKGAELLAPGSAALRELAADFEGDGTGRGPFDPAAFAVTHRMRNGCLLAIMGVFLFGPLAGMVARAGRSAGAPTGDGMPFWFRFLFASMPLAFGLAYYGVFGGLFLYLLIGRAAYVFEPARLRIQHRLGGLCALTRVVERAEVDDVVREESSFSYIHRKDGKRVMLTWWHESGTRGIQGLEWFAGLVRRWAGLPEEDADEEDEEGGEEGADGQDEA